MQILEKKVVKGGRGDRTWVTRMRKGFELKGLRHMEKLIDRKRDISGEGNLSVGRRSKSVQLGKTPLFSQGRKGK